jgi:hypothetical protein
VAWKTTIKLQLTSKWITKLGLETSLQEDIRWPIGETWLNQNILARIKGSSNSKALLLLSHYDSAPHSFSLGASDAGSGCNDTRKCSRFLYDNQNIKWYYYSFQMQKN